MHIIQYYHKPLPVKHYGGTERVIVWLIKGLKELGHKVTLIGPEGSALDCAMLTIPYNTPEPTSSKLKNYIPKDADIIHFHINGFNNIKLNIPFLNTMHGYGGMDTYDTKIINKANCFVSDSHRHNYGLPENPYVYNGLDPIDFSFREEKDDYFIFLARIDCLEKGLNEAINISKKAGVRLIIAGNVHRKSFVNSYWRFPLKRKLSNNCHYIGPVGGELKAALLAGAKGMIYPIKWPEPFGLVAIEALISGTPVITTHQGAMPEIIEHGKHGFLCNTNEEMVNAIKNIETINPMDCVKRVEDKFSYKKMAKEYIKLYQNQLAI